MRGKKWKFDLRVRERGYTVFERWYIRIFVHKMVSNVNGWEERWDISLDLQLRHTRTQRTTTYMKDE